MIGFLILAHNDPPAVLRLARRLLDAEFSVVAIHYDARSGPFPPTWDERIRVIDHPCNVTWGGISVITAVLRAIEWFRENAIPYDWLVLLSGNDYPIAPLSGLERYFESSGFDGFIDYQRADERDAVENETRYCFSYVRMPKTFAYIAHRLWRLNYWQRWVRIISTRAGTFFGVRAMLPMPEGWVCYRGSFWWILSRRCIEAVEKRIAERPNFVRAYARRLIPDESFFQTLLANDTSLQLRNDDLRFISWPGNDTGSPNILTIEHGPAMFASGALFARKFVSGESDELLAYVDSRLTGRTTMLPGQ